MKVIEHRLSQDDGTAFPFRETPNKSSGTMQPLYVVIHYTAGRNFEQSVNWLANPAAKASAHLVIGRDGSITQMADFNEITWHAGRSEWQNIKGLNGYSIGIELDNVGVLTHSSSNRWRAWFGDEIDDSQVIEAIHKNESIMRGWQLYTPEQLFTTLEVCSVLVEQYNLRDIIGHDDIAPGRKSDPGPAFPMDTFRSRLFGRREDGGNDNEAIYFTTVNLHIREGASTDYEPLPGSPLPKGTRLKALSGTSGIWQEVEVMSGTSAGLNGWVHRGYIAAA